MSGTVRIEEVEAAQRQIIDIIIKGNIVWNKFYLNKLFLNNKYIFWWEYFNKLIINFVY
jgi:hypothetical protein